MTPDEKQFFERHHININRLNSEVIKKINDDLRAGIPRDRILLYADWFKNEIDGVDKLNKAIRCISAVEDGIWDGLSNKKIQQYNDLTLYDSQVSKMKEIEQGLAHGLSEDQINVYKGNEHTAEQMKAIRQGFEEGLTFDQIKTFSSEKLSNNAVKLIKSAVETGADIHLMAKYFTNDVSYDERQAKEIIAGITDHLNEWQIDLFADQDFVTEQMHEIRKGCENGLLTDNVKTYARSDLSAAQMRQARLGYEHGLTEDEVKIYADPKFTAGQGHPEQQFADSAVPSYDDTYKEHYQKGQMDILRESLEDKQPDNDVRMYANEKLSTEDMEMIQKRAKLEPYKIRQLQQYQGFNDAQKAVIIRGWGDGLSTSQIDMYAENTDRSPDQMRWIENGLKDGLGKDQVKLYADPKLTAEQMGALYYGLKFDGLSKDQARMIADTSISDLMMYNYGDAMKSGIPEANILLCKKADVDDYVKCELLDYMKSEKLLTTGIEQQCLSRLQKHPVVNAQHEFSIRAIINGVQNNASDQELNVYTRLPSLSQNQISQIRRGFKDHLSPDQIDIYAKQEYSDDLMHDCRVCLENGIPDDHVRAYLDKINDVYTKVDKNGVKLIYYVGEDQLNILAQACERGFSQAELKQCDDPNYTIEDMQNAYKKINHYPIGYDEVAHMKNKEEAEKAGKKSAKSKKVHTINADDVENEDKNTELEQ